MASNFANQLRNEKKKQDLTRVLTTYNRLVGYNNPRWNPIQNPVHFALFNGVQTPGIGSFPQLENAQKWDIVTGPGLSGGYPIYRGGIIAEPVWVSRLYDVEDWDQLHVLLPVLENPVIGKRPQAIRVLHPMLDLVTPPIRAVVKAKWILSEPDDYGVTTFSINLIQFRRPTPSQSKPEAAKPEAVKDPWDQLIEKQTKQIQELAR